MKIKYDKTFLLFLAEKYSNACISIIEADYTIGYTSGQDLIESDPDPAKFSSMSLVLISKSQAITIKEYYKKTFKGEECTFKLFVNKQYN